MPARAKLLRAPEIRLHFDDPLIESSNNLPHSQPKHGLVALTDTFTCSLALNRMYVCMYSDTQMYLCSSSLTFGIDWDVYLGHMSIDMSSVLAALSSDGVPSVTGTKIRVASPQVCTRGLAGSEPSGTFVHLGQHLHQMGPVCYDRQCSEPMQGIVSRKSEPRKHSSFHPQPKLPLGV